MGLGVGVLFIALITVKLRNLLGISETINNFYNYLLTWWRGPVPIVFPEVPQDVVGGAVNGVANALGQLSDSRRERTQRLIDSFRRLLRAQEGNDQPLAAAINRLEQDAQALVAALVEPERDVLINEQQNQQVPVQVNQQINNLEQDIKLSLLSCVTMLITTGILKFNR